MASELVDYLKSLEKDPKHQESFRKSPADAIADSHLSDSTKILLLVAALKKDWTKVREVIGDLVPIVWEQIDFKKK